MAELDAAVGAFFTTSLDQYAATLGGWFDVSDAELLAVFPNLDRFTPPRLGFLELGVAQRRGAALQGRV